MHERMDQRGLRWDNDKKNELFVPRKSVQELISVMRTSEEMYLFEKNSIIEDAAYRGGRLGTSNVKTFTNQRTQPDRELKDSPPTITLKLSKKAIEELKMGRPKQFENLVDLVKLVANLQKTVLPVIYDTKPVSSPPTEIIRLPKSAVDSLRGDKGEKDRREAMSYLNLIAFGIPPPVPPPPPPQPIPRVTRQQAAQNAGPNVTTRAMRRRENN